MNRIPMMMMMTTATVMTLAVMMMMMTSDVVDYDDDDDDDEVFVRRTLNRHNSTHGYKPKVLGIFVAVVILLPSAAAHHGP
eukprot:1284411-Karenia_brevis.AAC.1